MMTAHELTELVLKFEELKEKHRLNYIIYTDVLDENEEYVQHYNIQSLVQFGELLTMMTNDDYKVVVTHITSHIGKGE